ncbi:LysR family transcriptional regulator [[Pseudomonas] boreopolis]|uniref:LysR family transcriptional regulator n=1 Tax=Xanthomonas boreopolis TaxID=86183 RepID=UPI003ADD7A81
MNLLDGIEAFVHVADQGSFAGAARHLDLSPSAVSKLIARTEDALGTRLLNRNTRSISLTLEGRMFLERSRVILRELDAAKLDISSVAEAPSGQLKISMPNITSFFLPVIGRFKDAYPAIDLELDFSDRVVDVIDEGFDVVFRVGQLADSRLTSRLIGNFKMQLVASPAYLERHGLPSTLEDLEKHQCIQYRYPTTGRLETWPVLETPGRSLVFAKQLVCNNADARLGLALQGRGVAFMPSLLADPYIDSGELVVVLEQAVSKTYGLHILWPTNKHATPRLREFIGYFHQHLSRAARYVRK